MNVRTVSISKVALDPANVRTHDERNLKAIADSLRLFGQRKPIVVMQADGGFVVIAGNGTLEAARLLGWDEIAVAVVPDNWTSDEAAAYAIADNRSAELAAWDEAGLNMQLAELEAAGWEPETLGFDGNGGLGADEVVEDDVPEPPADPVTKPGDLWLLGDHRVLCGDSTDHAAVARLMGGGVADAMFTDPPWNVAIGGDGNPRHRQRAGLKNDNLPAEEFAAFLNGFAGASLPYVSGDVYCVLGASEWPTLDLALRNNGLHWSATIIWVKDMFVLGRSKYHRRYEPIWYGWRDKSSFCDRRNLDDVWEIPRPKRSDEHPTMKPVELVARAIENSAPSSVLDPFLGSGTTLIAAEQTGRVCYGLELDPGYCDVIVQRWENLTGGKAVLADEG